MSPLLVLPKLPTAFTDPCPFPLLGRATFMVDLPSFASPFRSSFSNALFTFLFLFPLLVGVLEMSTFPALGSRLNSRSRPKSPLRTLPPFSSPTFDLVCFFRGYPRYFPLSFVSPLRLSVRWWLRFQFVFLPCFPAPLFAPPYALLVAAIQPLLPWRNPPDPHTSFCASHSLLGVFENTLLSCFVPLFFSGACGGCLSFPLRNFMRAASSPPQFSVQLSPKGYPFTSVYACPPYLRSSSDLCDRLYAPLYKTLVVADEKPVRGELCTPLHKEVRAAVVFLRARFCCRIPAPPFRLSRSHVPFLVIPLGRPLFFQCF